MEEKSENALKLEAELRQFFSSASNHSYHTQAYPSGSENQEGICDWGILIWNFTADFAAFSMSLGESVDQDGSNSSRDRE